MAEDLEAQDVEDYTSGRLLASDDTTQRALDAALARVRHYCGWHVSPVRSEIINRNGTGSRWLCIPTLNIDELTSVTENDVELDLDTVLTSAEEPGILVKDCGFWRYGTGNVDVELDHGFTADEAMDFREAVLSLVDIASQSVGTGSNSPVIFERVDDVETHWSALPAAIRNMPMDKSMLAPFRLLPFA